MMTFQLRLGAILSLLFTANLVFAYPALMGFTGTSNLPDANTAPEQTVSVALDLQDNNSGTTKSWRLLYGINDRIEAGVAYVDTSRETWAGTLKVRLIDREHSTTSIGGLAATTSEITIGAPAQPQDYLLASARYGQPPTRTLPLTKSYQLYAVHSQLLKEESAVYPALTGSLGVNWTAMVATGIHMNALRAYFTLEARKSRTTFVADFQTADSDMDHKPMSSVALRYQASDLLNAQFGFSNALGVLGGNDCRLFGGAHYQFSTR